MKKKEIVLVVDDDPGVKELTRDILELFGHSVLTAGTPGDALALCDQWGKQITIGLIDMSVSNPSANTVFEKILTVNPAAKVILTSIYSHDWSSGDVFRQGAAGFLKKPYRMTELMRMVEKLQENQ